MNNTIQVLDHGFVTLRNLAGPTRRPSSLTWEEGRPVVDRHFDADDSDPANAARISFGNLDTDVVTKADGTTRPRTIEDDWKLNEYLLKNEHASPFEMIQVWIEWKVPIFVDRQFVRHGTIRRNEESGRYTTLPADWYIPEVIGGKAANKKQGQEDNLTPEVQEWFKRELASSCSVDYVMYIEALNRGVAPEHARIFLHVNHYVHYITTVNLRNLMHFLRLRTHGHAQIEAQRYAEAIVALLRPHLPKLMELFDKHVRIKAPMTRAEAAQLAVAQATAHANDHDYLRESNWQPHDWVVDAILAAANSK